MIKISEWKRAIEAYEYDSFHKIIDVVASDVKIEKFKVIATIAVSFNTGSKTVYTNIDYAKSRLKPYVEAFK